MANPTIEELQNPEYFEQIAELKHTNIKAFVLNQFLKKNKLSQWYMYYQMIMITLGIFTLIWTGLLFFRGHRLPLIYSISALIFCFSLLIPVHELLHGLALKLTGAKKVHIGACLSKFMFYAEADKHVLNRQQFALVALTPLVLVKLTSIILFFVYLGNPILYAMLMIMSTHSLFCAGDIGLLSVFFQYKTDDIFTFDVRKEKKSFYYRRIGIISF